MYIIKHGLSSKILANMLCYVKKKRETQILQLNHLIEELPFYCFSEYLLHK